MLSVVMPVYNEELMVEKACKTVDVILKEAGIYYELVLVDDGSDDATWELIEKEAAQNKKITGVHFSRNFGKEAAVFAGMAHASGDVVVVMDCDLQHPPQLLPEMYALWNEGYVVIEGVK